MPASTRRFLLLGRLHERTTKTGTPYLVGTLAEQSVFVFAQGDGTWQAYLQLPEEARTPTSAAPALPDEETAYETTLAGLAVPDYDEPVRQHSFRKAPARRRTARRPGRPESV